MHGSEILKGTANGSQGNLPQEMKLLYGQEDSRMWIYIIADRRKNEMKRQHKKLKQKRFRKPKITDLCYIFMTALELTVYSPEHHASLEEALEEFHADCVDIARHNGYKESQIFVPGIEDLERRIREIWESAKNKEKLS